MTNDAARDAGNREESIVSGYLNRWAVAIVFSAVVVLAAGALLVDSDDLAHRTVTIGVAAFDSARAYPALESFARQCREKGGGDIAWRWLPPGGPYAGCDLYVVPALAAAPAIARGSLACEIVVAEREAHRYSRSAVVVRRGARRAPGAGWRVIYAARCSAAGYLAPRAALAAAGAAPPDSAAAFSGDLPRDERVALGVLFGAYDAGGISLERLAALEAAGTVAPGELEILLEGEAVPEVVVAAAPDPRAAWRRRFVRALLRIHDAAPAALRRELRTIGVAGLYAARPEDAERIAGLAGAPGRRDPAAGTGP